MRLAVSFNRGEPWHRKPQAFAAVALDQRRRLVDTFQCRAQLSDQGKDLLAQVTARRGISAALTATTVRLPQGARFIANLAEIGIKFFDIGAGGLDPCVDVAMTVAGRPQRQNRYVHLFSLRAHLLDLFFEPNKAARLRH